MGQGYISFCASIVNGKIIGSFKKKGQNEYILRIDD